MKRRTLLAAIAIGALATIATDRIGAATPTAACGTWEQCFCMTLSCFSGAQLCAKVGDFFYCYQDEIGVLSW
ncbi:MAG: hypothetical protein ACT4R6_14290 [Gemmatimonadaceae bacterium]